MATDRDVEPRAGNGPGRMPAAAQLEGEIEAALQGPTAIYRIKAVAQLIRAASSGIAEHSQDMTRRLDNLASEIENEAEMALVTAIRDGRSFYDSLEKKLLG